MKIILYMAITANGFIAKTDDDTSWISKEEWNCYSLTTRTVGNLVIGHRTYNILTKQPEFSEFKDVKIVVIANKKVELVSSNHFIAHSPKEALDILKNEKEVIVAGGGKTNASFLSENLVDEIYIDIEPMVFGEGIPIFHGFSFEKELEFLGMKNISKNEIQLHYKVLR